MKRSQLFPALLFTVISFNSIAENPDQILGVWKSSSDDVIIKIDKIGDEFQGRIVWFKTSNDENIALDQRNPSENLRSMPLKGVKVIQELSFNALKSIWEGGKFYDHEQGKTFECRLELDDLNRIRMIVFEQNQQEALSRTWLRYK